MSDTREMRELCRLQTRTRHASDLVVGSLVILGEGADSAFRAETRARLMDANRALVRALEIIKNEKDAMHEKQEDGPSAA